MEHTPEDIEGPTQGRRPGLTVALIAATPAPKRGQLFLRDGRLAGFALRITEHDARSFIFEARVRGRFRRRTLGTYPALSVAAARELALQSKAAIYRGEDPFSEQHAERAALTLAEVARRFIELYAKPKRKSWKRDEDRIERHFDRWRTRRLDDITPEDCARHHQRIAMDSGPVEANRTFQLLRLVYTWAKRERIYAGLDPTDGVSFTRERSRERFLGPDELDRINTALDAEVNSCWPAFFRLLLLLGARRGELQSARWSDVDLEVRILRLPETKAGRAHTIPLPELAVEMLQGLRQARPHGVFIFPGTGASGHIVEPKTAWKRICKRAGVEGVTVHDLRRTLGSRLAAGGHSLTLIGKALNHSSPSSTAVYARLDLEPVRLALEANAAAMLGPRPGRRP